MTPALKNLDGAFFSDPEGKDDIYDFTNLRPDFNDSKSPLNES